MNRPREGLSALSQIYEAGPQSEIAYWSSLADAHHMLGEHEPELAATRRWWQRSPSTAALYYEVRARAALNQVNEVAARLEESPSVPPHPIVTAGDVMEVAAQELKAHGHPAAGKAAAERALRWYRARPDKERRSESYGFGLGRALYHAGRWSDAASLLCSPP